MPLEHQAEDGVDRHGDQNGRHVADERGDGDNAVNAPSITDCAAGEVDHPHHAEDQREPDSHER